MSGWKKNVIKIFSRFLCLHCRVYLCANFASFHHVNSSFNLAVYKKFVVGFVVRQALSQLLNIKSGFTCVITTSNHTRCLRIMSLVFMAFAHQNNKYLGWVIMSLLICALLHHEFIAFFVGTLIYLRSASFDVQDKDANQIEFTPQTSWTFIVDCSKFLFDLISFISIIDCYFHPNFSFYLQIYLLPMCDPSSICFSSYTFQHHFITFSVSWCGK